MDIEELAKKISEIRCSFSTFAKETDFKIADYIETEVKKAKLETLEKVWSYTYNGLFLNEALNKIESEVQGNESNK